MSTNVAAIVWVDHAGLCTASAVDSHLLPDCDSDLVAVGLTEGAALRTLQVTVERHLESRPHLELIQLTGLRIVWLVVVVRPAEKANPVSPQPLQVRVPCVLGMEGPRCAIASLPLLGIEVRSHDELALRDLAASAAHERLSRLSVGEIVRLLPPARMALRELTISRPRDPEVIADPNDLLARIAQPLDGGTRRRHRAWQREVEVSQVCTALAGRRASVLVVGEPGTGKSLVVADAIASLGRAARQLATGQHPWHGRSAWLTSAARVLAGARYLGQWQGRAEQLMSELHSVDGVLVFESLLDLLTAGDREPRGSLGAFLCPAVQGGQLQIVTECTPGELLVARRLLPALTKEFVLVRLEPSSRADTVAVLRHLAGNQRRGAGLEVDPMLPETISQLCERFAPYRAQPGMAAEVLGRLLGEARHERRAALTVADAVRAFVTTTGLPQRLLLDDEPLTEDEIVAALRAEVIGQEEACRVAAARVLTFKAGLADPARPLGVLLFLGPTGVGKTALARAVSRYLYEESDDDKRLMRIDMSELSGTGAALRLFMQADGEPSQLIAHVRRQPFSVVLLDEIEKSAPEVRDALLGILDEGRATDALGRVTNFQSTLVILTSNVGSARSPAAGFMASGPTMALLELREVFTPELLNRIDAIVQLQPLDAATMLAIARKHLTEIATREGLRALDLDLRFSNRLVEHVASVGCDARYGARPLQRAIEREVVAPLARFLVEHPGLCERRVLMDYESERGVVTCRISSQVGTIRVRDEE